MSHANPVPSLAGALIVSCQAYPGEPMRSPEIMAAVAASAVLGGARAIRIQGVEDVRAGRKVISVPVIGLIKEGRTGVYITPTVDHVRALHEAGADIVALDGTPRPRPDGQPLARSIEVAHELGMTVMADCATVKDAQFSVQAGADLVGTTLAGYTSDRPRSEGPDLALIRELVEEIGVPVIAEGRISTPEQAVACLQVGAYAVVVGSAITHPTRITQRFAHDVSEAGKGLPSSWR